MTDVPILGDDADIGPAATVADGDPPAVSPPAAISPTDRAFRADSADLHVLHGEPDEVEVAAVVAALVAFAGAAGGGRGGGSETAGRSGAPQRRGGDPWAARGRPAAGSRGFAGPSRNGPASRPRTGT